MPLSEDIIVNVLMRDRVKLLAYIRSIVQDRHTAEDILQDISMIAVRSRDSINDEEHLSRWLRQTARHKALTVFSRSQRAPALFDEEILNLIESDWREYDTVPSDDLLDALQSCLDRLSPYGRQLIDLRYRQGLKGKTIAERVNRSVDSVYKTISRVHRALLNCIRKRMDGGLPQKGGGS